MAPGSTALILLLGVVALVAGQSIYVDKGNPYDVGPFEVGELTFTETMDHSPLHTRAFFPLESGTFAPVIFIGGLNGIVLAEFYETLQTRLASHGLAVFGLDYRFPVLDQDQARLGQDLSVFFQEIAWLEKTMVNRTSAMLDWSKMSLLCHSSGCDCTLRMLMQNSSLFQASVFLEPFSTAARAGVGVRVPALMYGTQLSEEGFPKCAIPGFDFRQFYDAWKCPRLLLNVKDFGHCDILDPVPWKACHETHFCKTTNDTRLSQYRQFVQGVVAAFLIATVQGYPPALHYIDSPRSFPLPLLDLQVDMNCTGHVH